MKYVSVSQTLAFAVSIAVLSGCASSPEEAPPPPRQSPAAPPIYNHPSQSTAPVVPRPVAKPVYKPMSNDTCGAASLQYLVGKPRTDIPVPLDPATRRVVCSTCITTQEYRADRQTIVFDSNTGLVKSVTCG